MLETPMTMNQLIRKRIKLRQELSDWRMQPYPTWQQEAAIDRLLEALDDIEGKLQELDNAE